MAHFHAKSGEGYTFIGDCIIELDALNPQVAARLAGMKLFYCTFICIGIGIIFYSVLFFIFILFSLILFILFLIILFLYFFLFLL